MVSRPTSGTLASPQSHRIKPIHVFQTPSATIAALLAYAILGDTITWPQILAVAAITGFVAAEILYGERRRLSAGGN